LPEKHDPAVRFLDVSKAVCLLLRANKKTTFVAFLFAERCGLVQTIPDVIRVL